MLPFLFIYLFFYFFFFFGGGGGKSGCIVLYSLEACNMSGRKTC